MGRTGTPQICFKEILLKYRKEINFRNHFPLPKEIFTLGLSSSEIAVYAYLLSCENKKTHQCFPSFKTIGKAVKMTTNTVSKYVHTLEEKGLIETAPTSIFTKEGVKKNGNLMYTINPIQDAVDMRLAVSYEQIEKARIAKELERRGGKMLFDDENNKVS